ncbi:protein MICRORCHIDIA 6 isoform X2 [Capsicum chacoense]|uniref:protein MICRORCHIDIA 6 isoform X2 n=1 Tax=Capsicum annuum TaxID=4072 RepID=UPI0007BF67B6|nr:protein MICRORCHIDIA 6 isoform X2 [Capsicum annuum]KAF3652276.1 putative nuclear transcription factor Y subunit B-5-like [Capsicum annuum]
MSSANMVGLCSNNLGGGERETVKLESELVESSIPLMEYCEADSLPYQKSSSSCGRQDSAATEQSGTTVLDQDRSPIDDSSLCSTSQICPAPLSRQFWKAGNYDEGRATKSTLKKGSSFLHIHPKFLHSNATSHKWAFGAVAELLDNAVDEIQNGATFVIVDKTPNPRNGSSALLVQDDGGGMDPEAIRRCMSFGFSDKKSTSTIGQYGNGFKTSSMRLGADVIVFSRCKKNRKLTQSIGLLSQTFLTRAGLDRIVVPLLDFEFCAAARKWNSLNGEQHFRNNLSLLLCWSPFATEAELLKQFDDIGDHGTKVIVHNLWFNDDGRMELDFEADPEDIRLSGDANDNEKSGSRIKPSDQHLANRLRYSLRAYLSVLYMRIPDHFCILLRGRVVEFHNIAKDLKYPEFIMYKPQTVGFKEGSVITTIGFLKEAPVVNVHGFNVYHKNRLILPFWHVVRYSDSRGRGVVGVLEANFIQPTHNKQDFEKTPLFQKLEVRLKEMTWEYWDHHCGLLGYFPKKSLQGPTTPLVSSASRQQHGTHKPVVLGNNSSSAVGSNIAVGGTVTPVESRQQHGTYKPVVLGNNSSSAVGSNIAVRGTVTPVESRQQHGTYKPVILGDNSSSAVGSNIAVRGTVTPVFQNNSKQGASKRKAVDPPIELENLKRTAGLAVDLTVVGQSQEIMTLNSTGLQDEEAAQFIQENEKLRSQCLECEKREEELHSKVNRLRKELKEAQRKYAHLLVESRLLDKVKPEEDVFV